VPTVQLPAAWPDIAAPVANLLDPLGPALPWWLAAAAALALGLALHRRRPRLAVALAAAATLALGIAVGGLVDDAYIQFRHAANWAAGHGPVYDPGQRVEGASGGLWMGALAAGSALTGVEAGAVGRVLGLALAPIATLLVGAALARTGAARAALAALAWAALPTPALYAASGMETAAAAAALWLALAGVALGRRLPAAAGAAALAAIRPEIPVLAAVPLPWWRRLPAAARTAVVAALAAGAVLTAARMAYFGEPLPHPALVKAATSPGVLAGLRYLARLLAEAAPLLLLLPPLLRRRPLAPALALAAAAAAAVAAGGGDWMPGVRYLLLPLALLPVAAAAFPRPRAAAAAVTVQAALALLLLAPLPSPAAGPAGSAWRRMAELRVQCRWWEALGHWLGRRVPRSWTVAAGAAGAIAYASGLPAFDLHGLATPVGQVTAAGWPGHRLWGLDAALARRVELLCAIEAVPQDPDPAALRRWLQAVAARSPRLVAGWQPVELRHPPARRLDVLRDVVWVRQDLLYRFLRPSGQRGATR